MRFAVVGLLVLSACATRAPIRTVPSPAKPAAAFREHVLLLAVSAGVQGRVFVTVMSPGQMEIHLAETWRVASGVYVVAFNIAWLLQASEYSIREIAAHEVCHIALGHADGLADGLIDVRAVNDKESLWHRQVYRCEVQLIGEDLFCQGFVDKGGAADTVACRAYLRNISS